MFLTPVLKSKTGDTFKLPGIVCDHNESPAAGMTGNHLVKWSHRTSLTGELSTDLTGMCGSSAVVIQHVKARNKSLDNREITLRELTFSAPYTSSITVTELMHIRPVFRLKRSRICAGLFLMVKIQILVSSMNFSIRMRLFPVWRAVPCHS